MRPFAGLLLCVLVLGYPEAGVAQTPELLLFGDRDHSTFLGCLTCNKYDSKSVCNKYGDSGSKYSSTSIWNHYGEYGSRYSSTSPWNPYASEPPVIVDHEGGFYGYFTAAKYHPKRTTIKFFLAFLDNADDVNEDLEKARDIFCHDA